MDLFSVEDNVFVAFKVLNKLVEKALKISYAHRWETLKYSYFPCFVNTSQYFH